MRKFFITLLLAFTLFSCGNDFNNKFYSKDNGKVYYTGKIIEGADPDTFEVLSDIYSKDKKNIYIYEITIKTGIDVESFEVLNDMYTKDKNNIYKVGHNGLEVMNGTDLETFEVINRKFSKDKNNVYYGAGKIFEGVDPYSFEYIDFMYTKDKSNCYYGTKIVDISECEKGFQIEEDKNKDNKKDNNIREYQDKFMHNDECIFIGDDCVKKGVDNEIIFNMEKKDEKKLIVNYSGEKIVNNLYIGMGNGSGGASTINNISEGQNKPGLEYVENLTYRKNGTYNILVILKYKDGTYSYNTKKIIIDDL